MLSEEAQTHLHGHGLLPWLATESVQIVVQLVEQGIVGEDALLFGRHILSKLACRVDTVCRPAVSNAFGNAACW